MRIVFFFQAEDGIRDLTVTGVQTCALPIYSIVCNNVARMLENGEGAAGYTEIKAPGRFWREEKLKIGRASCRERSVDLGGRRIIKKKKQGAYSYVHTYQ